MRVVIFREKVSIGLFLLGGVLIFLRDVVRITCIFFFHLPFTCIVSFIFTHVLLIICMQSIISVSHKDALISFVLSVSEMHVFKDYLL